MELFIGSVLFLPIVQILIPKMHRQILVGFLQTFIHICFQSIPQ